MRICLMVEGQEGVTWEEWVALARACEDSGLEGLFRSDHYLSMSDEAHRGALDAWATLSGLAAITSRIRLGTMVSPATFRHPSVLAKMAATADHISGGRVELGLGAGWFDKEHSAYGFDFPETSERMAMLAEQIEIIHGQWSDDGYSFKGSHYSIDSLNALPKPVQRPHPPIIVGGSGGAKSIALAARWADEYNTVMPTLEEARTHRRRLERAWRDNDRDPAGVVMSFMSTCIIGRDEAELMGRTKKVLERTGNDKAPDVYLEEAQASRIVGTTEQAVERLKSYEAVGIDRVMLQHLAHADVAMVELLGSEVVPAV